MIIIFASFFMEAVVILSFLEQAGVLIPDIRTNTLIRRFGNVTIHSFLFWKCIILIGIRFGKLFYFLPKP